MGLEKDLPPGKGLVACFRSFDSKILWMRYRDTSGRRHLESTGTEDWDEAQRRLRERLPRPVTIARWRSCAGASDSFFEIGRRYLWRIIPSRRFAQ